MQSTFLEVKKLTGKFWILHLEVKLKQIKLDWRVLKLWFHKNCKSNVLKGKQESGKLPQLFIESEEHTLM